MKIKIIAPPERNYFVWIGGSISNRCGLANWNMTNRAPGLCIVNAFKIPRLLIITLYFWNFIPF
uniref:Uncharacterized protein n=1 Tax=Strigamia maritima TaxID=126957 RepID=T1IVM8_STRMM